MSVLDKATTHFKSRMGDLLCVDVPEWATKVYYRPINLLDQGEIYSLQEQKKTAEAVAMTIVLRARNEDGSRMFKRADKFQIMNDVDPDVITKIIGAMNGDDGIEEDEDELLKNSETTVISALRSS